jgi:FkbM family methyltransferase
MIAKNIEAARFLRREGNMVGAARFFIQSAVHSKRPVPVSIRSRKIHIRPCTPDLPVVTECFSGEFQIAIAHATPLRHGLIVDAGGYIGASSIVFASAFPDALVISIEPSRANYKLLCRNVARFPNIVPINSALGAHVGSAPLVDRGTGEWGYSIVPAPFDCPFPQGLHDTNIITIPSILEHYQKDGIDLLKLDIEGGEFELLKERPSWVSNVRVIIAELHERIVPGVTSAFTDAMFGRRQIETDGEKILSLRCE